MLLTLLFTVPWEKIVIGVIHVHDLGYHPIGFSGNGAFGCFFAYGLYKFGENPERWQKSTAKRQFNNEQTNN